MLAQIEKSNRDDVELAEAGLVLLRQYMPKSAAALGNSPHAWSEWAKALTKKPTGRPARGGGNCERAALAARGRPVDVLAMPDPVTDASDPSAADGDITDAEVVPRLIA